MKIFLAGHNVDLDIINELKALHPEFADKLTPETISAAYARISRDPRPINELRASALDEVEKAKHSNSMIIFEMGHSSIAEHVTFNFDIVGLSRLAIEELEHFRLASYTEKSQRYITLTDDYVIPSELNPDDANKFKNIIALQNACYHEMFDKLKEYVFFQNAELFKDPKNYRTLEGWAKEDARYITALATEGQLGLTVNARTLELMLRRFAASELAEIRELGKSMYEKVKDVAPSVVKYTEATDYDLTNYKNIKKAVGSCEGKESISEVSLVDYTQNMDDKILSAILHTTSNLSYIEALAKIKILSNKEKENLLKEGFKHIKLYNSMLREFEFGDFLFELNISAACFGQMKRHRLCTITAQEYDLNCGLKIPNSIKKIGYVPKFLEIVEKTEEFYNYLAIKYGKHISEYILTNAHRRKILVKINARELYHLSRLREDAHAQWDIKELAQQMVAEAKKVAPISMFLIGGKDMFNKTYEEVYGVYKC